MNTTKMTELANELASINAQMDALKSRMEGTLQECTTLEELACILGWQFSGRDCWASTNETDESPYICSKVIGRFFIENNNITVFKVYDDDTPFTSEFILVYGLPDKEAAKKFADDFASCSDPIQYNFLPWE